MAEKLIAVIRISGLVDVNKDEEETLFRIRLRRKYACVLLKDNSENRKLLLKVRNLVAFGEIDSETLSELIEKRSQLIDKTKKTDLSKIAESIGKKSLSELNIKPFFRLHPPRGGIDSKLHFGVTKKSVLGNNKEKINDLIRRML